MTIKQLFQKAFVGGRWYVGYRCKGEDEYTVINTPAGMWIADPTAYSVNGEHYIFVEVFEESKKKAAIGYYQFENGQPVYKGIIIENSYHMSYPCVFEYKDEQYMIPESSANDSISLYKAEHFPDKWVKVKDLVKGEKFVDSTVVSNGDGVVVLSYRVCKNGWELVQFSLNMGNKTLSENSKISYCENVGRPAGYIYDGNKRPAQDCRKKYGENLLIYEVDSLVPYKEHKLTTISACTLKTVDKYDRIHTYTQDGTYEVVDLFKEKIDLLHGLKIFYRAYLRK